MKRIIAVRHCKASGQERSAVLTKEGIAQSQKLKAHLMKEPIDRIISSPFIRAVATIEPLAHFKNVPIETDERLSERILSSQNLPDWLDHLEHSFTHFEAVLEGGESSQRATDRVTWLIQEIENSSHQCTVLVTHGNLLALLLRTFDERIGFAEWKQLSNPDVYEIFLDEGRIQRNLPLNW
ncbi:histidine phosphatase family protein [Fictibacillus fluitans]|uniref:Histidine phosphatase family protein n=1 Tax=Fictibacillus fluitans TaxID=3058422 RepID=A0ABT8HU61_9BACL|nr:histidine phosphatase family protein [Fictibacillus sp. NE201]MDN4524301.1 histidine phosphatase family protein [Fictibacillus sp. NE201]